MILDQFKVPPEDQVRVSAEDLRRTVIAIFEKMGVTPEDAAIGADVLVMTDLRGVETHGVSNMLRVYVQQYRDGTANPNPNWRIIRESASTAAIDADGGLGVILGPKAIQIAIDKARNTGMGVVAMKNGAHLGAVGHHAMLAAREDMVGMCATATGPRVVPTFGAEPRFGTNAISIAAPAKSEPPVLFDAATCSVAVNKIKLAARVKANLLPGWVTDKEGNPIMEEIPAGDSDEYHFLPLGGSLEQGSHKGYGMAFMVEILGTLLSGAVPSMLDPASGYKHYFAAYDIAAFTDVDRFKETMDQMLRMLRTTRPVEGHDRVLYPGLSEYEEEQERRAHGIPLHKEVIEWFGSICGELGIPPLTTR